MNGLRITGLGRDVSWGFYVAQFTYLVGVAASAVMVVLPYYLHNYKAFGRVTILGEFLAVAAVTMCLLFIVVDMGRPDRVLNVIKYPTPDSILFWDMIVLNGYLLLNILIGWNVLESERHDVPPPHWVKMLSYVSIPWAVSIHTVTAFLYAGLPGRGYWLTAVMAPRFLSSAFCAGPSLLILLCLLVRKYSKFDPGKEQIQSLAKIVTYAVLINVFLFFCEVFTVFYSQIPDHMLHFQYLFFGLEGKGAAGPHHVVRHRRHDRGGAAHGEPGGPQEREDPGLGLRPDHHHHLSRQGPGADDRRLCAQPPGAGRGVLAHGARGPHHPGHLGPGLLYPERPL